MVVMSLMRRLAAAARPDVPDPREAVRRDQRLGQAQQLVDGAPTTARTCSTRATTRTPTPSSWRSWWRSSAASTSTPTCSGRASPTPATTIASAPTRRRRRSCRSSSARSSRTSSSSSRRARPPPRRRAATLELGVTSLPVLAADATDRNRTSPFAFTGNKFEFRAVGSSAPIYWPQTVLNTAVADSLKQLADELEKLDHGDFEGLTTILSGIVKANKQVLFEGNGYSEEWHAEAERRGLPNNKTTVDALPALTTKKAKELFSSFGVLSERELASRVEINWERYVKVVDIEASCAVDIASTMILPAAARYLGELNQRPVVEGHQRHLPAGLRPGRLARRRHRRARARPARGPRGRLGPGRGDAPSRPTVIPAQDALREVVDELETLVADDLWPLPKYRELLFQY